MEFFVYGTLTDSVVTASVLDNFEYRGAATLSGLHRVDGTYPTLLPGRSVEGRILRTDDMASLDRYEGVDSGLYVRVTIPREDGGTVETYIGNPASLAISEEWPGTGEFETRIRQYLETAEVVVQTER